MKRIDTVNSSGLLDTLVAFRRSWQPAVDPKPCMSLSKDNLRHGLYQWLLNRARILHWNDANKQHCAAIYKISADMFEDKVH